MCFATLARPGEPGRHRQAEGVPPHHVRRLPARLRGPGASASARAASSPGGTRQAAPWAISAIAVPSVVIKGAPQASASRAGRPKPSSMAGYATTVLRRSSAGTAASGRYPVRMIRSPWRAAASARSMAARPQPICPPSTRTASRCVSATRSKAATREATPLRGSSVPTKETSGRSWGTPLASRIGRIGPRRRFDRREALVVHSMGRHDDRRPHLATGPQPRRGDLAHADEGPRLQGGTADRPPKEQRLGSDMPLRVVEEGAVVDRHDAGHGRPFGHRVVRRVVDHDAERPEEAGEAGLLEEQSARPRHGHRPHHVCRAGRQRAPSVPRPPGATPWSGRRRARAQPARQLHGVVARSRRTVRGRPRRRATVPAAALLTRVTSTARCADGRRCARSASGRGPPPSPPGRPAPRHRSTRW